MYNVPAWLSLLPPYTLLRFRLGQTLDFVHAIKKKIHDPLPPRPL